MGGPRDQHEAALIAALVAGLALAAPAAAQTSRCGWEFGEWVCRTEAEQRRPSIDAHRFPDLGERFDQAYERARRMNEPASAPATEAEMVRQQVGKFIAEGNCSLARRIALQAGHIDLAEQVDRICTPAP
jgi:hypothetical protein